jgi:hypothetical protein
MRYSVIFFAVRYDPRVLSHVRERDELPCKTLREAQALLAASSPEEKAYIFDNVTKKKLS